MAMDFAAIGLKTAESSSGAVSTVGLVRVRGGEIVARESLLVGTTNEWTVALLKIAEFVQKDVMVSHEAHSIAAAIRKASNASGIHYANMSYYSTYELAQSAIPKLPDHKLETVAKVLKLSEADDNDSEYEAMASATVVLKLGKFAGVNDIETLMKGYKVELAYIGRDEDAEDDEEVPAEAPAMAVAPVPERLNDDVAFPDDDNEDTWSDSFEAKQAAYVPAPREDVVIEDDASGPESAFPEGWVPQTRKERRDMERQLAEKRSREALWGNSGEPESEVREDAADEPVKAVSEAPVARQRVVEEEDVPAAPVEDVEQSFEEDVVAKPEDDDEDDEPDWVKSYRRDENLPETTAVPVVDEEAPEAEVRAIDLPEADIVEDEAESTAKGVNPDEFDEDEEEDEEPRAAVKDTWYNDPSFKLLTLPLFPLIVTVGLFAAGRGDLGGIFAILFVLSIPAVVGMYLLKKKKSAMELGYEELDDDEFDEDEDSSKKSAGRRAKPTVDYTEELSNRGRRARQAIQDATPVQTSRDDRENTHAA